MADRFVAEHGGDFRFVFGLGWHRWSGCAWRSCDLGEHVEAVKDVTRAMVGAPDIDGPEAKAAMRSSRVAGALKLAESDPVVALGAEQLDGDTDILATPDGIVDLHTGTIRPAERGDLVSWLTQVGPADEVGPRWSAFIDRCQPDPERRALIQRLCGLGATGRVEHILPLLIGVGANGKTVFKESVTAVLEEYAHVAPPGPSMLDESAGPQPSAASGAVTRDRTCSLPPPWMRHGFGWPSVSRFARRPA